MNRSLHWIFASVFLFTLGACVSSDEPLVLGNNTKLLPEHALLHLDLPKNDEFYKLSFRENKYVVVEKGSNHEPDIATIHKLPGLPEGYHVGWMFMGKGTVFEANYYNFVWLETSSSGRAQLVIFTPTDESLEVISKELSLAKGDKPNIRNAAEMVRYAQTIHKLSNRLEKTRLDVYDLSKKGDYAKAKSIVGAAFLDE